MEKRKLEGVKFSNIIPMPTILPFPLRSTSLPYYSPVVIVCSVGFLVSLLGITLLFLVSEGRKLKLYGLEVSLVGISSFEIEDQKFSNKMFT